MCVPFSSKIEYCDRGRGRVSQRVSLVTGGNRGGIDFEVSRQLAVSGFKMVMTARDLGKVPQAAAEFCGRGRPLALDVTDPEGPGRPAPRPVAEGADTIFWLATFPEGGPHRRLLRNRSQ